MVMEFCTSLQKLLSHSESFWDFEWTKFHVDNFLLFISMVNTVSRELNYPDGFLCLSGLALSLAFESGCVPGGQPSHGCWQMTGSLRDHLKNLSPEDSLSYYTALTKYLQVLHTFPHSRLRRDVVNSATAHTFVILSSLPNIEELASDSPAILLALDWGLSPTTPDAYPEPYTGEQSVAPHSYLRLQCGTLWLIHALLRSSEEISMSRALEAIPEFMDKLYLAMSRYTQDATWISSTDRLKTCIEILDRLFDVDWINAPGQEKYLQQWLRVLLQSVRPEGGTNFLQLGFDPSLAHARTLVECNRLFGPQAESSGPSQMLSHEVGTQCVAYMALQYVWRVEYNDSREESSTRLITQLARLQDRSALLLEKYIDSGLFWIGLYIKDHSENDSNVPPYLYELQDALKNQISRIEVLKRTPPFSEPEKFSMDALFSSSMSDSTSPS